MMDRPPTIIQGGMGVGVSRWPLAKAVSKRGQMGVVSGTGLDSVIARCLQQGDSDGNIRRALSSFPWRDMAQRVLDAYFVPGGKPPTQPFKLGPMPTLPMKRSSIELMIISNYVEVFLAKEGHGGAVGINYLEKVQLPTLPSLFGAMLAGVDFVLMGAGIPLSIPGVLDGLSRWEAVELNIHVEQSDQTRNYAQRLDPREWSSGPMPNMDRPRFLGIIASDIVGKALIRRSSGHVDGFVVEGYTAGGHNAPPRRTDRSENRLSPQYGPKDIPDVAKIRDLGRPFWLAGGWASPQKLKEALALGASGIQVGTVFAYCRESAISPELKRQAIAEAMTGSIQVRTDFQASPTGYPFKTVCLRDTMTSAEAYGARKRICDVGYLRQPYCKGDSELGYRCSAEPLSSYLAKGGSREETIGKQCLCNGLLATIGLGQTREDGAELAIVTSGDDFSPVVHLVTRLSADYRASDVLDYLTS